MVILKKILAKDFFSVMSTLSHNNCVCTQIVKLLVSAQQCEAASETSYFTLK